MHDYLETKAPEDPEISDKEIDLTFVISEEGAA